MTSRPPQFVVVGHLTRDAHPGHDTLGGTVTFAAITAQRLGYRAGIVTRAAAAFPQSELLDQIDVACRPSPTTTTFRNLYDDGRRRQFVQDVALPLTRDDVPREWRAAQIALLGPVAREVSGDLTGAFEPGTLLGVVPQGWLRRWDESGRVGPREWEEASQILPHASALILSEEDMGDFPERLPAFLDLTPLVVLTRGRRGCTVYPRGAAPFDSPAFPAREVDPTGAGDVFSAAFLIYLFESGDPAQAARFANCTASFAVEAEGTAGIPTRAQVQARLKRYY